MKKILMPCTVALCIVRIASSQDFTNLDFEAAQIQGLNGNLIPATNAFPGWMATAPFIAYDDISLSGASISIFDTNPPYSMPPIQGAYFALLIGGAEPTYGAISLGQTGQIPVWAQSISFWGTDNGMQITFSGQLLNFLVTGGTANYNIYTADISAFAGQTEQLLFTVPLYASGGKLDNIQFSSLPIPEPSSLALGALGGLLVGFRRWRIYSR